VIRGSSTAYAPAGEIRCSGLAADLRDSRAFGDAQLVAWYTSPAVLDRHRELVGI